VGSKLEFREVLETVTPAKGSLVPPKTDFQGVSRGTTCKDLESLGQKLQ
jgi:hypothetical protein